MRPYTPAERCMLLLFAPLGEGSPLSPRTFRRLRGMLEQLGPGTADPDGALDGAELRRLGLSDREAERVLRLLERKEALALHLDYLRRRDIRALTRISPEYPQRLWQTLGDQAPMLLYCAGNVELFQRECVSLVGSRQLRAPGRRFAAAAGRAVGEQGFTYVSGGAVGADTVGLEGALSAGGCGILFLPDSLEARMEEYGAALRSGRLLLVSEGGTNASFSTRRAYGRNRLIHAMGRLVLTAQTDYGSGGTWQGVTENLKNGWSPVYMYDGEPDDPGTKGLLERGCEPVSLEQLKSLRSLTPEQTALF